MKIGENRKYPCPHRNITCRPAEFLRSNLSLRSWPFLILAINYGWHAVVQNRARAHFIIVTRRQSSMISLAFCRLLSRLAHAIWVRLGF